MSLLLPCACVCGWVRVWRGAVSITMCKYTQLQGQQKYQSAAGSGFQVRSSIGRIKYTTVCHILINLRINPSATEKTEPPKWCILSFPRSILIPALLSTLFLDASYLSHFSLSHAGASPSDTWSYSFLSSIHQSRVHEGTDGGVPEKTALEFLPGNWLYAINNFGKPHECEPGHLLH